MGYGDEIIGSGMARGAQARGKRIAFGDGKRILWGPHAEIIYRGNPNIAKPGQELASSDLEWVAHYKHHRMYFHNTGGRWIYDRNFKIVPGELFFNDAERAFAASLEPGFVLIEPRVKSVYPNKQWPMDRYVEVAKYLMSAGYPVAQFVYDGVPPICPGVEPIVTESLRLGLAALTRARLHIGCEGALTHGSAAVGVDAVVLFGGFTDPYVLGYGNNINLTGGAESCGKVTSCQHCKDAMAAISVEEVCQSAMKLLAKQGKIKHG